MYFSLLPTMLFLCFLLNPVFSDESNAVTLRGKKWCSHVAYRSHERTFSKKLSRIRFTLKITRRLVVYVFITSKTNLLFNYNYHYVIISQSTGSFISSRTTRLLHERRVVTSFWLKRINRLNIRRVTTEKHLFYLFTLTPIYPITRPYNTIWCI